MDSEILSNFEMDPSFYQYLPVSYIAYIYKLSENI